MGNLCSTSSDKDAFSQSGRTVGPAPAQASSSRPPKVGGPPRTLGGSSSGGGYGTTGRATRGSEEERMEARRAAAQAAEARAAAQKPAGKLGQDLQKQRQQTRKSTLEQLSAEEGRMRDSDAAASARAHN